MLLASYLDSSPNAAITFINLFLVPQINQPELSTFIIYSVNLNSFFKNNTTVPLAWNFSGLPSHTPPGYINPISFPLCFCLFLRSSPYHTATRPNRGNTSIFGLLFHTNPFVNSSCCYIMCNVVCTLNYKRTWKWIRAKPFISPIKKLWHIYLFINWALSC